MMTQTHAKLAQPIGFAMRLARGARDGGVAALGLAKSSGWPARAAAGALGVAGVVLVIVEVERSSDHGRDPKPAVEA